jgi:hypothetical protein
MMLKFFIWQPTNNINNEHQQRKPELSSDGRARSGRCFASAARLACARIPPGSRIPGALESCVSRLCRASHTP